MLSPDDLPDQISGIEGPLVSVILATYEPEQTIEQAIKSVSNQTYGEIELVIVNGSGDAWLAELGDTINWITYVRQNGNGIANAWNEGIVAANGKYLSFLADDDYYVESKTERQVTELESTEADIVYSDEYILTPEGTTSVIGMPVSNPENHYREYFRRGQGVPHLTVVGRTKCFEHHQFDESLEAREDPHLWVRLFRSCTPAYVPEPLAYKRRRKDSLTSDPEMMYRNELREIEDLADRFPEFEDLIPERKRWARYRYGRNLLEVGEASAARRIFVDVLRQNPTHVRAAGLLIASLAPVRRQRVVGIMESIAYVINKISRI